VRETEALIPVFSPMETKFHHGNKVSPRFVQADAEKYVMNLWFPEKRRKRSFIMPFAETGQSDYTQLVTRPFVVFLRTSPGRRKQANPGGAGIILVEIAKPWIPGLI